MATFTTECSFSKSYVLVSSLTKDGKAIDAKLHTAVSFLSEYSYTSLHKLEDFIVPRFF